jgi:hypothetical protein
MATAAGAPAAGPALGLATQLEVATLPFGASSSGFTIKLDPSTGLQVRTATTFGPSFAERALTSGDGTVSLGVSFMSASFDRVGDQAFNGLQLRSITAGTPAASRSSVANIRETATTVAIAGRMGVTDKLDVGIVVPLVSVKIEGSTALMNGSGAILTFASGSDLANGLGDIAGLVKYRFYSFGTSEPDPGGLAVMATVHLPTGNTDSLRGLGVTRTLVSLIASGGQGRFRPHANGGFEAWSKSVGIVSNGVSVEAQHQFVYAGGFELEAAPKVTILADLVGSQILGGGKLAFQADATPAAGATSSSSLVALPEGITRISVVPGVKVNLKGKLVLSLNALVALKNDGLHARVMPNAGVELIF